MIFGYRKKKYKLATVTIVMNAAIISSLAPWPITGQGKFQRTNCFDQWEPEMINYQCSNALICNPRNTSSTLLLLFFTCPHNRAGTLHIIFVTILTLLPPLSSKPESAPDPSNKEGNCGQQLNNLAPIIPKVLRFAYTSDACYMRIQMHVMPW